MKAEYIERKKLVNSLKMWLMDLENDMDKGDYGELSENKGAREALENCICEIEEQKAADVQPVNKWISVDEALPKVGQRVLVYYPDWIENEELQVAHLEETYGAGIQFVTYDDVRLPTVTYWQPLPEPPETMKG